MTPSATRARGRPRDPAAGHAILAATIMGLAEDGYAGLTMDGIAERAGVSKATIYRRWPSKEAVVLAAAEHLSAAVPVPDTGTLRGDLDAIAVGLAAVFGSPTTPRLVGALVSEMVREPDLAHALRDGFLAARRSAARAALERARERGEVPAEVDLEVPVDLLAAPFYYRALITGDPVDDGYAATVVDAVLAWLDSQR
jgi:AcrR family transcriptional regulator